MIKKTKVIKERVYHSNLMLEKLGLIIQNFGNASARHCENCLIKPSGINLNSFKKEDVVAVNINDSSFSGKLKPSSDLPTHLILYRELVDINGIVHTHSPYATAWAQTAEPIPCLGTTHADFWKGEIPVTRPLDFEEIDGEYEKETGKVILETLEKTGQNALECPGILVAHHGPFTWGASIEDAVKNAEIIEYIARTAWLSLQLKIDLDQIPKKLHDRHFLRKNGPMAYYGQKKS